jgi:DNA-binding transcriptional LysR family regulator
MATPSLSWDDVRVLLAVLQSSSFRAAAKRLRVEQSTVSRRIADLERSLGQLFDRTSTGPRPTELARKLRPYAERMAAEWQQLVEQGRARDQVEGRVALTTASSFAIQVIVPLLLPRLRREHPALQLDLWVDEREADLGAREADLALRFVKPSAGDLTTQRIARLPVVPLAHHQYAARAARNVAALDWIVLAFPDSETQDGAFLQRFPSVTPLMRTNMHLAQIDAVRAGLGVALLPKLVTTAAPELVELEVDDVPSMHVDLWLVAPRTASASGVGLSRARSRGAAVE